MKGTAGKRSRQERALAQRTREFEHWSERTPQAVNMLGHCRKKTGPEDKASKASRDVTALKNKLGRAEQ